MKSAIRVPLTARQLVELVSMYRKYMPVLFVTDEHTKLLLEHMAAMLEQLKSKAQKYSLAAQRNDKRKIDLKFLPVEALAFYQVWQMIDTSADTFGSTVICSIVGIIDRASKQVFSPQNI